MRLSLSAFTCALAILLVAPVLAASVSYSVYTPSGSFIADGHNVSLEVDVADRAPLETELASLAAKQKQHDDGLLSDSALNVALNRTADALNRVKYNTLFVLSVDGSSKILHINDCFERPEAQYCLTKIIFPEDDGPPFGNAKYDYVHFTNGSISMPVTIAVVPYTRTVVAKRVVAPTKLYPGATVTVHTTVTNTGSATVEGVQIDEYPPLPTTSGEKSAFIASLNPGDVLSLDYTLLPTEPGNYSLHGFIKPTADYPDSTFSVLTPLSANGSAWPVVVDQFGDYAITLTNNYIYPINVSTLAVSTKDRIGLMLTSPDVLVPMSSFEGGVKVTTFSVPAGKNVTFRGSVGARSPGTGRLNVRIDYRANVNGELEFTIPYVIEQPGIRLNPAVANRSVNLTMLNTARRVLGPVDIFWGDGVKDKVQTFDVDRNLSVTHAYGADAPASPVIVVRYPNGANTDERNTTITISSSGSGSIANASVAPSASSPSAASNASAQRPTENATRDVVNETRPTKTSETPPPAAPEETPGVFRRFLNWLDNLFS